MTLTVGISAHPECPEFFQRKSQFLDGCEDVLYTLVVGRLIASHMITVVPAAQFSIVFKCDTSHVEGEPGLSSRGFVLSCTYIE